MKITPASALAAIPQGLRNPLIEEYQRIVQNFLEHRWLPSELSGGRFSEIVYTILDGFAQKKYAASPSKPSNFVKACQQLENNAQPHIPRSFRILIPRLLPALYEIRNNRNVGHAGGDVDPNHMDSVAVLSICNWIMGELVRVYHNIDTADAAEIVDALVEIRIPAVWSDGSVKRILKPSLKLPEQILILTATTVPEARVQELIDWIEVTDKTRAHFMKTLRNLHADRLIEFNEKTQKVRILPPGSTRVQGLISKHNLANLF